MEKVKLTCDQERELLEAFRCCVALYSATKEKNHSTCGCFHIQPFNGHWDEKTVTEISDNVRIYIGTWVLPMFEQLFGFSRAEVDRQHLINWHESEARRLRYVNENFTEK